MAGHLNRGSSSIHTAYMLGGSAALPQSLIPVIGDNIGIPGMWDYLENENYPGGSASAVQQPAARTVDLAGPVRGKPVRVRR